MRDTNRLQANIAYKQASVEYNEAVEEMKNLKLKHPTMYWLSSYKKKRQQQQKAEKLCQEYDAL